MAPSKTGVELGKSHERPTLSASIAPALTALLDHIAEDLAREYVRLMEVAARKDGADVPTATSRDRRKA